MKHKFPDNTCTSVRCLLILCKSGHLKQTIIFHLAVSYEPFNKDDRRDDASRSLCTEASDSFRVTLLQKKMFLLWNTSSIKDSFCSSLIENKFGSVCNALILTHTHNRVFISCWQILKVGLHIHAV